MKKALSLVLSLVMILTVLTALPFAAQAVTYQTGGITVSDEFSAWGLNSDPTDVDIYYYNDGAPQFNSYKGMSYDAATNTLTLNSVPYKVNSFRLFLNDMGDLKVKVAGTCGFSCLCIEHTNVTLTGTGTLILNPPMTYTVWGEQYVNEHIFDQPINADNGTLHIGNTVTLDIQNGNTDSYSAGFLFNEAKDPNTVFTYAGNVSAKPVIQTTVDEAYSVDTPDRDSTNLIKHVFNSAGKIYKLEGYTGESNYWIQSSVCHYDNHMYTRLVQKDGGWFEELTGKAYYQEYEQFKIYDFSNYSTSYPEGNVVFTPYEQEELPEGLKGANAVAYVRPATDSSGEVYSKDSKKYVLIDVLGDQHYNDSLAPTNLAKTGHQYAYVMFEIKTLGDSKYLEFAEDLGHYAESFDESYSYYDYVADAKTAAKSKGYAPVVTTTYYPAVYHYEVTNNHLKFTPGTAQKTAIGKCTVSGIKDKVYTGKAITQSITVKNGSKTLKSGTDYTVSYKNNTKVGTATVTLTGKGNYTGTKSVTFKITKAANPLTLKGLTKNVKYSAVKSKNVTVKRKEAMTVTKAQGTVTYAKSKGDSKITVDKKSGNVTVKKGLKKGTYKVTVKVTAAGNSNYKSATKSVTFKIVVK